MVSQAMAFELLMKRREPTVGEFILLERSSPPPVAGPSNYLSLFLVLATLQHT